MNIYFDTEFSTLDDSTELISMGAVAETGECFYCELPLPDHCSEFVQTTVRPLLEEQYTISKGDLERRLAAWLAQFPDPLLVSDSTWDFFVLRKTLTGAGHHRIGPLTPDGPLVSVPVLTIPPLGDDALQVFEAARAGSYAVNPRQHHALDDARALCAGVLAVQRAFDD